MSRLIVAVAILCCILTYHAATARHDGIGQETIAGWGLLKIVPNLSLYLDL